MKKILLLAVIFVSILACNSKDGKRSSASIDGEKIFKQNCAVCHGYDGKLGANGSKDLTASKLSMDERKTIIKNGKGAMVGLGSLLDDKEIHAVAAYTFKLK